MWQSTITLTLIGDKMKEVGAAGRELEPGKKTGHVFGRRIYWPETAFFG
jgi:hypothetical protein